MSFLLHIPLSHSEEIHLFFRKISHYNKDLWCCICTKTQARKLTRIFVQPKTGNNALFCNSTKTRKSRLISLQIISWTIKNYLAPSRYFWVSIYLLRRIIAYKINCFWPNLPPDVHIMTQINCTTDSATCSPNNLWKRGKHVKTKDDQLKIKTISNIKNSNHRSNVFPSVINGLKWPNYNCQKAIPLLERKALPW